MKQKNISKPIQILILIASLLAICFFAFLGIYSSKIKYKTVAFANNLVQYTVNHYQQKLVFGDEFDADDYNLFETEVLYAEPFIDMVSTFNTYEGFEPNQTGSTLVFQVQDDGSTVVNLFYDRASYFLNVNSDFGFQDFSINSSSNNYHEILYGQTVQIDYTLKSHYLFSSYQCHKTGDDETIINVVDDEFEMPAFDVTLNLSSEIEKFSIVINKYLYETKTTYFVELVENLFADYGSTIDIEIDINTSYHPFTVDSKSFSSNNNNVTLTGRTLTILNISSDDTINVFLEKDYFSLSLFFGDNDENNNFVGGSVAIVDDDVIFDKTITSTGIYANVYLGADVSFEFNEGNTYRYGGVQVRDENNLEVGYSEVQTNQNVVTIKGIATDLNVNFCFVKTYVVKGKVDLTLIDSESKKIGKVNFDIETPQEEDIERVIDKSSSISINATVNDEYSRPYEFKTWQITYQDGTALDLEAFDLTEDDLQNPNFVFYNINSNLIFTAVFGKKNISVTVAWDGRNGTITTETVGDNDNYMIEYGEDIQFLLKESDQMHFLKTLEMSTPISQFEDENVYDTIETQDGLVVTISNITENLTLNVNFASNTWWEHFERTSFYGEGSEKIPYYIVDASDLALLSYLVNNNISALGGTVSYDKAYYILANDIDCGYEYFFVPIGTTSHSFNGTFDYNYHTIENIWLENESEEYKYDGLFFVIGEKGKIINQFRTYTIFIIMGSLIVLISASATMAVIIIERRTKIPDKIVTIQNYLSDKNNETKVSKKEVKKEKKKEPKKDISTKKVENPLNTKLQDKFRQKLSKSKKIKPK